MFSYGDKRHEKINLISLSSGKQYRKNRTKLIMIFLLYSQIRLKSSTSMQGMNPGFIITDER